MPPEADQGNGGQAQEAGAGNQSQGQESGSQQGQQNANQQQGGQGQESGGQQQGNQQGGGAGPEDISKMTPEQLQTYAAKLQKDLGMTRTEAARHRTALQEAQGKLTEAERAKVSDQEKLEADLQAAQSTVQERETRIQELESQVEDLTKGASLREALGQAGAINPQTAFKVGTWKDVKVQEDGTVEPESFKAAIQALKASDPYLFRRTAMADAGAGGNGGAPEGGSSINDFVRGRTGR